MTTRNRIAVRLGVLSIVGMALSVGLFLFLMRDMWVPGYVPRSRPDVAACLFGVVMFGLASIVASLTYERRPTPPVRLGRPRY